VKVIRQIGSLAFVLGLFTCIFAGVPWHVMVGLTITTGRGDAKAIREWMLCDYI